MLQITLLTDDGRLVTSLRINRYVKPPDAIIWGSRCFVNWNKDTEPLQYREVFCLVYAQPGRDPHEVLPGQKTLPLEGRSE